jgi:hypothetical protein
MAAQPPLTPIAALPGQAGVPSDRSSSLGWRYAFNSSQLFALGIGTMKFRRAYVHLENQPAQDAHESVLHWTIRVERPNVLLAFQCM